MKKLLLILLLVTSLFNVHGQVANQANDLYNCDINNDGFEVFNLTLNTAVIIGAQDPAEFSLTYHISQADADLGINVIISPTNFINTANPQSIFARLERNSDGNFDTTDFALIVLQIPVVQTPVPLEVCDDDGDGFASFDLTVKDAEITNGDPDLVVSYHSTLIDAESNTNPLPNPYSNDVPFLQIVYARVESGNTGCWTIVELELIVLDGCPDIDSPPVDVFINEGDGNGSAQFNLTVNESLMLGAQDPNVFLFSYHLTFEDAQQDNNSIANPETYQNIENPQAIYVRFYNDTANGYVVTNFEIETDGVLNNKDVFSVNFSVYPNPASDVVVIQSKEVFPSLEISLFDMNGRLLYSETNVANSDRLPLDISKLSSGMYLLRINSEEKTTVKQFVKQ